MARHSLWDFSFVPEDRREPPDLDFSSGDLDEEEMSWAYEDDPWLDYYDGDENDLMGTRKGY